MGLEYIKTRGNYFMTESGKPWTPIGFNDSYTWPGMQDDKIVDYFKKLEDNNVNCLRMMFEYADNEHMLLETKIGKYNQRVVNKWYQIFELAEKHNIRLLMSAYDTFWQWINWDKHAYNKNNGGYLGNPASMFTDEQTLRVHKSRFEYLISTFGGTGTIFAWDLWNELHPQWSNGTAQGMDSYLNAISDYIRSVETELYGKTHLQTCSIFKPALTEFKPLNLEQHTFRNDRLDFANVHAYDVHTIDNPKDTISPALAVERIAIETIDQMQSSLPYFDSENGPIGQYNQKPLDDSFDTEYHFNMSWAHLASGGAGSSFRWPYRQPHTLSDGMLNTLKHMSTFCSLINWNRFYRTNMSSLINCNAAKSVKFFACGTANRSIVFALRTDALDNRGMYNKDAVAINTTISMPATVGTYRITSWKADTGESSVFLQETQNSKTKRVSLDFNVFLKRYLVMLIEHV